MEVVHLQRGAKIRLHHISLNFSIKSLVEEGKIEWVLADFSLRTDLLLVKISITGSLLLISNHAWEDGAY